MHGDGLIYTISISFINTGSVLYIYLGTFILAAQKAGIHVTSSKPSTKGILLLHSNLSNIERYKHQFYKSKLAAQEAGVYITNYIHQGHSNLSNIE